MSQENLLMTDDDEFVYDGSVDLRGRPAIRTKSGGWRACSLIIGYEFVDKLGFGGIVANLMVYMTTKLHEGTISSSNIASNWVGTLCLTPLLGAYIADSYLGRFRTFAVFSCIHILGMGIMMLSVSLKCLRPPDCPSNEGCEKASSLQIGSFYFGLYVVAVGSGGLRPNISTFGGDQFDDFHHKEKLQKNSFFNWWMFIVVLGTLSGQTFIVYIEDNISWGAGYGIMTAALIIAYVVFMMGTPIFRYKVSASNPLQRMGNVICRMIKNWKMQVPSDSSSLHEVDSKEYLIQGRYPIAHTQLLRCLDKAAVQNSRYSNPCTVTDIEETKLVIRILPIWLTVIFPSTIISQTSTLFVKQAMTLDRHMGSNFEIPAGSVGAFLLISTLLSLVMYDRFLVAFLRRFTGNPRGISILQRMGVGMILQSIAMVAAVVTEIERLKVVKSHGMGDDINTTLPVSVFTLVPQYLLMGIAEAMVEVAKMEFFYDQAPKSMRSLASALFATTQGIGAFLSSVILTVVSDITGRRGHRSWILNNINASRLDYYYAFLGLLSLLNFVVFFIVSYLYAYKKETSEASTEATQVVECNRDGIQIEM